ncbi:MAG: T9SS type A sorting domain-containing protein, partial [Ferruginibacter sp.]
LKRDESATFQLKIVSGFTNNGSINLHLNSMNTEYIDLVISDITGRIIHRQNLKVTAGNSFVTLNTSNLANGIYYLYGIRISGRTNVVKFVKQ